MTKGCIALNDCGIEFIKEPFILKPIGKSMLWGGTRLNDDYSKGLNLYPLAETWECSTHKEGISEIATGPFKGWQLDRFIKEYPQVLGEHNKLLMDIPVIVKLIDANKDLSIQVHPSDDYARNKEAEPYGKTEMWYVLDSQKDSSLVYGFHNGVTKEQVEKSIQNNTICSLVHRVAVHPNDIFFIEPGTVHAICSGVLVAEIQQKSNLTYRLYDYDRIDKDGKKRELHIKKALDVININYNNKPLQPMRILKYSPGSAVEVLYRCEYFQVERILVNTDRQRNLVEYGTDDLSFRILLCIDGACTLFWKNNAQPVFKGDCLFIPADSCRIKIHGKANFLDVSC